jgi:hypothetical protein
VVPALLEAQAEAARLIAAARAAYDDLDTDSAAAVLRRVLDQRVRASPRQQADAYVLLGAVELTIGREAEARAAFRSALALDPGRSVDTLAGLQSELLRVFTGERDRLLRVGITVPTDTLVASDGHLPITARPSRSALVVFILSDSAGLVRADTHVVSDSAVFVWDLRGRTGVVAAPAEYDLQVVARDAAGAARPWRWSLNVAREQVDTQPHPAPPDPSVFLPESTAARTRQPSALVHGLLLGVAALAAPLVLERASGGSGDPGAYAVAGALVAAGIMGYVSGPRTTRPLPANVEYNGRLRADHQRERDAVAQANERARARARVRIRSTAVP